MRSSHPHWAHLPREEKTFRRRELVALKATETVESEWILADGLNRRESEADPRQGFPRFPALRRRQVILPQVQRLTYIASPQPLTTFLQQPRL